MRSSAVVVAVWAGLCAVAHAQGTLVAASPGGAADAGGLRLVEEVVEVTLDRQHATTTLRQVHLNESRRVLEGRYQLRVGEGARVEGFAYWNGSSKIVGEVFERQSARRVYDQVTQTGRDPGLLEQAGEGEFTFRVFPIQPRERKRVEVRYSRYLRRRGSTVEYRVPIGSPDSRVEIVLDEDREIGQIASSTHRIAIEERDDGSRAIRTIGPRPGHPTELVLRYRVSEVPWALSARLHRDRGRDAYLLVSLATPSALPEDAVADKDITLVLDRSGSMAGEPLRQAREAATDIIRRLRPRDRVNVIAFSDMQVPLFARPRTVTEAVRAEAVRFVSALSDSGGTDLATALESALASQHVRSGRPSVILFLTDGRSNPQAALDVARRDAGDARVFTVGVGNQVERPLLARLASLKRGRFVFVNDAGVLEARVSDLYRQIEEPVLVDVTLEATGGRLSGRYPRTLPDLFRDDELVISSRVEGAGPVEITLRGKYRGDPVTHRATVHVPEQRRRPWVGRLWAQSRVDDLLEEIALHGEQRELVDEVVHLAVAYDFVTPYTAFLAIPESELTDAAADTLAAARERRQSILADHPDAVALGGAGEADREERAQYEQAVRAEAAPAPEPGSDEGASDSPMAVESGRAGCASCTVGARRDGRYPAGIAGMLLAWLLLRRRRRRR
jgi:Ca-activated chloride channel family protein